MQSATTDSFGSGGGVVRLPAGYVDADGAMHREVDLAQLTGREEEYLASVPPGYPAATVITELLASCVRKIGSLPAVDTALIRNLLVSDREYLILRLWQITNGDKLRVMLSCRSEDCGKDMEIDFSLADIPIPDQPLTSRVFKLEVEDAGSLEFRLPTGEDQEVLAEHAEDENSVEQLLRRCIVRMPATLDLKTAGAAIEQRMQELMPRPELEIEGVCPECGLAFSSALDVTTLVLSKAAKQSQRLPYDVHRLAWHYHWPEWEILSMPLQKRSRYLHLLEEELERTNPF